MAGASQASGQTSGSLPGSPGARIGAASERNGALEHPVAALARLRLVAGGAALLGMLLFVFGTSWDIQWHSFIGRDRALVPPHQLMLGGIVLAGAAALVEIVVETLWARTTPAVTRSSTPFAGAFYGSLGAYVAGFGALAAGVGFPLDVAWHALYGIDVSVWAPFHVQIITGMAIAALGAAYMLLSGANLVSQTGAAPLARVGRIGVVVASAGMLCALLFFLDASFSDAAIQIGPALITTFALMVGAFGGFALALVAAAWPSRFAATGVALVYYAIDLVVFLLVPPITDALVVAEHQSYRRGGPPSIVVVSWLLPITLIIAAAAIDLAFGYARRKGLGTPETKRMVIVAAVIGLVLSVLLDPLYAASAVVAPILDAGGAGVLLALAALLLGGLGAWGGTWLGLELGASLGRAEK